MDESFSVSASKFPEGEPADDWTVEEVLRWSLDAYQTRAIERTSKNIASLRDQCERECEDVMTLHEMATEMAYEQQQQGGGTNGSTGEDAENVDPQQEAVGDRYRAVAEGKPTSSFASESSGPSTSTALTTTTSSDGLKNKPPSSALEILMVVGPHAPSKYLLRPRPGQPCLLGRSKGKKFVKNGVSLHKDQEISTTHGKFVAEMGGGLMDGAPPKFYFVDVGSTNGTVYDGDALEPNERLPLEDGMELKVGNSVLRVVLG